MSRPFTISIVAVVLMVLLRVAIGWHFLHEGLWKYQHTSFSASGYLSQARGPLKEVFFDIIPDPDGRQRLNLEVMFDRWTAWKDKTAEHYHFSEEQRTKAEKVLSNHEKQLRDYLQENGEYLPEFTEYFEKLDAWEEHDADPSVQETPYKEKRHWDERNKLKATAAPWLTDIDKLDTSFHNELAAIVADDQQKRAGALKPEWTKLDYVDNMTTYGLLAVGLCLMVGLFTRLAAVGGALFLLGVILSQPALPNIYPPLPPQAGHVFIVTKEVIEMIALLMLSATAVGRWGGLDFFIHHLIVRPIFGKGE